MEPSQNLHCMDIQRWRASSKLEVRDFVRDATARSKARRAGTIKSEPKSCLIFRQQLSPVDVYCYLRARFGEPNGFQNRLRRDSSDNWIHWDFNLKAANEDVYISGTDREVHFMLSEKLADDDWPVLIQKIKSDFRRVGSGKSEILRSLEKWVTFPNKFVEVANLCGELHGQIVDNMKRLQHDINPQFPSRTDNKEWVENRNKFIKTASLLSKSCLELSLITPVLAEAFINMTILILCKQEIRENQRQFDAFIRSQIDTKIFDLPYKCEGFNQKIDPASEAYKNFKRIMDKRNNAIHGNIDPEREQIEVVYFDGKRPLHTQPGDNIAKRVETMLRLHEPQKVIKDYEDTYQFLVSIAGCIRPGLRKSLWRIMEDPYPGYDLSRKITGGLFSSATIVGHAQGIRYDDELLVNWG